MQELARQMIENLEETAGLYDELLTTERDKQLAIVESRIEALAEIVARQEQLVGRAAQLEAERLALRRDLARADVRLGPSPRLGHLIAALDGPERDLLAQKRDHLSGLAHQIHEVSQANVRLLRGSSDRFRAMLDEAFSAQPPAQEPGRAPAAPNPACQGGAP
jgi:flagellar biosynthesis/type III secretory pathway chaperone